jgi:hypothetical protein
VLAEQAESIAARSPDVVALQEVTANSLPQWRAALSIDPFVLPFRASSPKTELLHRPRFVRADFYGQEP